MDKRLDILGAKSGHVLTRGVKHRRKIGGLQEIRMPFAIALQFGGNTIER
jgi:hypothetical protein